MRVAFLVFDAFGVGGTARTVLGTAEGLLDAGHDVHMISVFRRRATPFFPHPPRMTVEVLKDIKRHPNPPPVPKAERSRLIHEDDELATWFSKETDGLITDAIRRWNGDCLITTRPGFNCLAASLTGFSGLRVAQEHINLFAHTPSLRKRILRDYGALDAVVTLTDRDMDSFRSNVPGMQDRVFRIPNAVPMLEMDESAARDRSIVAIGRLVPQKGFDLLIDAFALAAPRVAPWKLKIFGSGQDLHQLRRRILDHGVYNSAFCMGATQEVGRELQRAGIFVLSSRFEGFGMVITEAMHCGAPVISFDCPEGPREILQDGRSGVLVPPLDVPALAEAMVELVHDEDRRRALSEAGLRRAGDYSLDIISRQWVDLLQSLRARA